MLLRGNYTSDGYVMLTSLKGYTQPAEVWREFLQRKHDRHNFRASGNKAVMLKINPGFLI